MAHSMPQHRLSSHGRRDSYTDGPAPMTIVGSAQAQQQAAMTFTDEDLLRTPIPATTGTPPSYTQQAYGQVLNVHQRHRDYLAQADDDFSPEQRDRYAAAFDGSSQLDVLEQAFDKQEQAYESDYESAVAAQSANIDESAALRIRDRVLDRLNNADKPVTAARQLVSDARPEELGVMLQEIPSWLESRKHPTDFIEQILADKCPEVADKAARLRKARQASAIGRETIRRVREGIRTAAPPSVLMKSEDLAKYDPTK